MRLARLVVLERTDHIFCDHSGRRCPTHSERNVQRLRGSNLVSFAPDNRLANRTVLAGDNQQNATVHELGCVAHGGRRAIPSSVLVAAADDISEGYEGGRKPSGRISRYVRTILPKLHTLQPII